MARVCTGCGYGPIGPYTDNCPICAEPVRGGGVSPGRSWLGNLPTSLIVGWIVIGIAVLYLFAGDEPWLILSLGICGAAWWAVTNMDMLLWRYLGGSLLVLFIPGIILAFQPDILPGLDRREMTPERFMQEIMAIAQGESPGTVRMRARMKTISTIIYVSHLVVAFPMALFVPPFLSYFQRRRLGQLLHFSKAQAIAGIVLWVVLLSLLCWRTWPTMESWADEPNNQMQWPQGQMPIPPEELE